MFLKSHMSSLPNERRLCDRSSMSPTFVHPTGHTLPTAAAAKSLQSCPTLCDPIDGSPPGSPVPGILQARTLEWVAISFSNAGKWKVKVKSESEVAQSCSTVSDPMGCSPPGSSAHGIFQARVLEWGAIAFSDTLPTGGHISGRYIPSQAKLNIHFQKNVIGTLSYTIHKYTKINSKWIKN